MSDDMEEILEQIETFAGSRKNAVAWYRLYPIASLDGLTAEKLVAKGRIVELKDFLDSVENGATVDMQCILWELENDRRSGNLAEYIPQQSWVRYGVGEGDPARIEAVDRIGRRWGYELEERIRKRIETSPLLSVIKLSEQSEYPGQAEALEGIFEYLLQDGTLRQYRQDWFYRTE
ncbi:hypothetical protein KG088_19270 [Halomonas sp. TRM85114]|uniref:hypothetical protein n=1 Tax=Halomonas jincaotanensis TaxID=2810616 RepID=UPI001BD55403|nr:hypothetical protein [Halomonas jincaotanensis]MBS9405718.1 hypothetical protein [Halomonas jincaotanensis]